MCEPQVIRGLIELGGFQMQDRVVLTEQEFCKAVNISRTKCWRLRKQGQLPHLRIGDRIGFLQRHIDEFLANCEHRAIGRRLKKKSIVQLSPMVE